VSAIPENAWRFDPAASVFLALAGSADRVSLTEYAGTFVLSSSSQTADYREIALTIDKHRLRPIEQTMLFTENGRQREFHLVETAFQEIAVVNFPSGALSVETELMNTAPEAVTAKPKPPVPDTRSSDGPSPEELLGLEVETLITLDRAGALLGEQVGIRRKDRQLEVEGLFDTQARKAEIERLLEPLAARRGLHVSLQTFQEAQRGGTLPEAITPRGLRSMEVTATRSSVYEDLKEFFAAKVPAAELEREIQRFTVQVLERSLQARLHARALSQLVSGVSADQLRLLTPEQADKWRAAVRDRSRAFERETEALRKDLQPIFFQPPPETSAQPAATAGDFDPWSAAVRLFELASANDVTVGQAFAISTNEAGSVRAKSPEFWQSLLSAEALAAKLEAAIVR